MATIVPTITAEESHTFRAQIETIEPFADRLHIDLMDGEFTPNKSLKIDAVWLPEDTTTDIHLMYQNPEAELDTLIKLKPATVVIPAESDCDVSAFAKALNDEGIQLGLALLPGTTVDSVQHILSSVQHVLIFSGNLGHQGGSFANLDLLDKVEELKRLNSNITIGWDGGVNEKNVKKIASAGIDIINVGGYIQTAPDPVLAYETLVELIA